MNIKINKKIIALLMCYMLCVTLLPTYAFAESNSVGNGVVNNGSLLVKEGDWLYYRNSYDGGSIYKVKTDGTKNTKINDISSCDITIDGDWVYFRSLTPKDKYYELFRIRKNGTGLKDLNVQCVGLNLIDNYILTDKYIYYYTFIPFKSIPFKGQEGLFRIKKDGTNKVIMSEDYTKYEFKKETSKCCKFDGNAIFLNDKKIIDIKDISNTSYIDFKHLTSKWIYFYRDDGDVCRITYDGSKVERIQPEQDEYENGNCNFDIIINDDWIYNEYTHNFRMINSNKKIHSSKLTEYSFLNPWRVRIIGDWIYYYADQGLYRIKTDGTNKMQIYKFKKDDYEYKFQKQNYLVSGNDIYYLVDDDKSEKNLFKYDGKNGTRKILVNEDISEVNPEKVWKVNFNKRLDENTINKNNIIVTDGDNIPINVSITLSNDKKSIYLKSNMSWSENWDVYRNVDKLLIEKLENEDFYDENYALGGKQIYKVKITNNVKSENGKNLKKEVVKKFKVKDNMDYEN